MTQETTTNDTEKSQTLEPGDLTLDREERRGVVHEVHEEEVEVADLRTGELLSLDPDSLERHEPKVWLCTFFHQLSMNWAVAMDREVALARAASFMSSTDSSEEVSVWLGQVEKDNWELQEDGSVFSRILENTQTHDIPADRLQELGDRQRSAQDRAERLL
jgi:hypothetical protein